MFGRIYDWLDERTSIKQWVNKQLEYPVPDHVNLLYCFGGLALFIILLQTISGVFMLFFYVPKPENALESIFYLSNQVPLGWLIRNIHRWGATTLVAMVFFHMVSVFLHKAYQKPRELNWFSGLAMFLVVMFFTVTGSILPWDWRGYWLLVLWTDYVGSWPVIGERLKDPILSAFTVGRSYAIHIWILPFISILLLFVHFKMVRKHGISGPL